MTANQDKRFSTDHLRANLKQRTINGLGIMLVAQGVRLLLQVGSIAIMARLLKPADFGLVAMATVFISLAMQFTDSGLSIATIQRNQITHAQVSNLFWINGGLGAGLCFIGILFSPFLAEIYNEPRLTLVMAAMSINLFFGGLLVQPDALLRRQMRFKAASIIDVSSMAIGIIAGIIAALRGLEYWALVISPIATISMKTIMSWISTRWLPSNLSRGSGVRQLLGFGANLTSANFIGYLGNNITPFLVGYVGGAQFLGLFNRAYMLTSIPSVQVLPSIIKVVQPALSRVAGNPDRIRDTIRSVMGKLVLGTMFITATTAALADSIIEVFLGPGWEGAVPIFRILAVYSIVEPIEGFLSAALVATGRDKENLRWKIISLTVLLIAIGIGTFWGAFGVVLAYAFSGVLIRTPVFIFYVSRFLPVTYAELIKILVPPALCALGMVLLIYALRQAIQIASPVVQLTFLFTTSLFVYMALCTTIKSMRRELVEIFNQLKNLNIINSKVS